MRGRHSFGHGFDLQVSFFPRGLPQICPSPLVLGLGSGSSHMLKTEFLCHFWSSYQRYRLSVGQPVGLVSPNFKLVSDSLVVRVDGCQLKGPRFDPRRGTEKVP